MIKLTGDFSYYILMLHDWQRLEILLFLPGEDAEYANWGWAPPWLCAPLIPEKEDGRSSPASPPTPSIPLLPSWGAAGLWYLKWTGNSTEVILKFS